MCNSFTDVTDMWNSLPAEIFEASSMNVFKNRQDAPSAWWNTKGFIASKPVAIDLMK
jgi:hypothetical protein